MNTMLTIPNSKLDAMGKYNRESYLNKYDFNLSKIAINKVCSFCNYKCWMIMFNNLNFKNHEKDFSP